MAPLASPTQNNISSAVQQSAPVDLSAPYDPSTLRGKTVVLTGGATGLGAAFARRWAAHGANLIIGDVNDDAGLELVAELRSTPMIASSSTLPPRPPPSASSPSSPSSSSPETSEQQQQREQGRHCNQHHHFVHTDVTSWPSQVALFRRAAALSPTGEIDAVVPCAGIGDRDGTITGRGLENPTADLAGDGDDADIPPAPPLQCLQVNLVGTMYTAHLALFWLQQDGNKNKKSNKSNSNSSSLSDPDAAPDPRDARDRHLLLIGSWAGLSFLPGVPEYVASKHGVTGLFRALRATSHRFAAGARPVRVNLLCPHFVDTPILPARAVAALSGLGLARLDDVVDAATRLLAGSGGGESGSGSGSGARSSSSPSLPPHQQHQQNQQRIAGRALVVGPRVSLLRKVLPDRELNTTTTTTTTNDMNDDDDSFEREPNEAAAGGDVVLLDRGGHKQGQGVWECYAHDLDTVDFFIRRYVRLLNTIAAIHGWVGFFRDLFHALFLRKEPSPARRKT